MEYDQLQGFMEWKWSGVVGRPLTCYSKVAVLSRSGGLLDISLVKFLRLLCMRQQKFIAQLPSL